MTYGMPGGERATQKLTPNIISELQFFGGLFSSEGEDIAGESKAVPHLYPICQNKIVAAVCWG